MTLSFDKQWSDFIISYMNIEIALIMKVRSKQELYTTTNLWQNGSEVLKKQNEN